MYLIEVQSHEVIPVGPWCSGMTSWDIDPLRRTVQDDILDNVSMKDHDARRSSETATTALSSCLAGHESCGAATQRGEGWCTVDHGLMPGRGAFLWYRLTQRAPVSVRFLIHCSNALSLVCIDPSMDRCTQKGISASDRLIDRTSLKGRGLSEAPKACISSETSVLLSIGVPRVRHASTSYTYR